MFRKHQSFLFLAWLLILVGCNQKINQMKKAKIPPNVIIIFADDMGYGDLGLHGYPWIRTPNLDAFAKESLELTNFHVGTTCTPSRAGLMTGRNANRNNAWHTIAGCSILNFDEETMPEVFDSNGYTTAMFGKWHLGDNYPYRPHDRGFQKTLYHGDGGVQQTPDYWNNNYFDDTYFRNGIPEKTHGYCTDVWFKEALHFIKNEEEKPFFLYLSLNAAHSPFNVPEVYAKKYSSAPLTEEQKRFYGMISNIDDNFGTFISYLKQKGLFENSIIIFSSDNGTAAGIKEDGKGNLLGFNSGLRGTKGSHYDGGHKVPFFISWPGGKLKKGAATNELISHVDLLPTLAELSRLAHSPHRKLDGINVANVLSGDESLGERLLVVDTQRNQWPIKGKNSCVMKTTWRLINGTELYDTSSDPAQKKNIAKEHPDLVAEMQGFYDSWWTSIEPNFKYSEIPLGHPMANPTLLTIHDLHTKDPLPWNQEQIREGKTSPDGFYSINVTADGTYRFKLFRYPPESGLAINDSPVTIEGSAFRDDLPEGMGIDPIISKINIGDISLQADANPEKNYVSIDMDLKKGIYELQCLFVYGDREETPSYYTEIEKLN